MIRLLPGLDEAHRSILLDFRADMFQRLTFITAVFTALSTYTMLFLKPIPYTLFLLGWGFVVYAIWLRQIAHERPNFARYTFVVTMYLGLLIGMLLYSNVWLSLLIFPILLISALLMSNTNIIAALSFFLTISAMTYLGYADYPLAFLGFGLGLMVAVNHTAVSTFNIALKWYFSMHERADTLLDETRDRRAELIQTLKSLETAYDTQKRLQQQLIYAREQAEEARRMKERFASNISHELRTPLNLILGFSEIMHLTPEVYGDIRFTSTLHRDIHQIYRSSRHLLDMIDDVLDLSHIELSQFTLNYEQTAMTDFLNDVGSMVQNLFAGKQLEFIVDIAPNLSSLDVDKTRLRQVIINLVTNAQRFTNTGYVTLSAHETTDNLIICVEDTGTGIDPAQQHLIFEEFYQVNYSMSRSHGGAGLGLPITKRFVEAHDGTIDVHSEPNSGSTFTVRLPLPHRKRYIPTMDNQTQREKPRASVLLLDSDQQLESLLTRHLTDFDLINVSLDDIESHQRQHQPIAMIANQAISGDIQLDVSLPIITCKLPSITWLVKHLQVNDCLPKPVSPQQVRDVLHQYDEVETVMIVDDDMGFVQLVQRSIDLLEQPYRVLRAYDGQHALEVLEHHRPDIVFLDLDMPVVDGFEVIEQLKQNDDWCSIPVILMTATRYVQETDSVYGNLQLLHPTGLRPLAALKGISALLDTLR